MRFSDKHKPDCGYHLDQYRWECDCGAKTMSYDSKCYDLAEAFLEDEPALNTEPRRKELAQIIQDAIEGFIEYERKNYDPPDPPGFEGGFAENH
jgi:hypothetical protein